MQNEFFGRKNEVESKFSGIAEEVEGFRRAEERSEEKVKDIINKEMSSDVTPVMPVFGEESADVGDSKNEIKISSLTNENEVFDTVSDIMKKTKDDPFQLNAKINEINKIMRGV